MCVCACSLPIVSYWQPAPWECWAILLDLGAMAWFKGIPLVIPVSLKQPLPSTHPPSCPVSHFPYLEAISNLACLKQSYLCLPHLALPTVSPIFINGNSVLPVNTFCLSWPQTRLVSDHIPLPSLLPSWPPSPLTLTRVITWDFEAVALVSPLIPSNLFSIKQPE